MFYFKICLITAAVIAAVQCNYPDTILTKECLTCLCHGISGCDMSKNCTGNDFACGFMRVTTNCSGDDFACGPFRLTKELWDDAEQPTVGLTRPDDEKAFKECAFDFDCAGNAVKDHLRHFDIDCNNDREVNCLDFAYLFRLGVYTCKGKLDKEFKERFYKCQNIPLEVEEPLENTNNTSTSSPSTHSNAVFTKPVNILLLTMLFILSL